MRQRSRPQEIPPNKPIAPHPNSQAQAPPAPEGRKALGDRGSQIPTVSDRVPQTFPKNAKTQSEQASQPLK